MTLFVALAPTMACAQEQPLQPAEGETLIGFAYGYPLKGEPVYGIKNDTLFVSGTVAGVQQPYFPRRQPVTQAVPCLDHPENNAILDEAHAAATTAATSEEWTAAFVSAVSAHLGSEVVSVDPRSDVICVVFTNGDEIRVFVPASQDIGRQAVFNFKDEIERQRQRFSSYVERGIWIVWGAYYTMLVPSGARQAEAIAAMDKIARGGVLTAAERQNTPFIDPQFEADFRAHMREVW